MTFCSKDVGHEMVMVEHCGGNPPLVLEVLNEKEYRSRISWSLKKQDELVELGGPTSGH